MEWLAFLKSRNLVQDISDDLLIQKLPKGTPFYTGIDPSSQSLQLGNLVPLIVSMWLGKFGFRPVILFGGATGSIGDPSGKNKERNLLSLEEVEANVSLQIQQVTQIFARQEIEVSFVNNFDWTQGISFLDFLRDVGKHFTVNYMLAKDSVKTRIEGAGISYTEFSYMLLQAYDFYYLYQNQNIRMQIGGSDQWGNMTAGLELIRRKCQGDACALCFPLVTDSQGKKFGKTADGAIWLDANRTSPYELHQFFLNISDDDVIRYLKMFTFMETEAINVLEQEHKANPEKRKAQTALANELCTIIHGASATAEANKGASLLFGGDLSGAFSELSLLAHSSAHFSTVGH